MYPVTVSELAALLNASVIRSSKNESANSTASVTGVSIDTRTLVPGDVFFALPGSHCHGMTHASAAQAAGAAAIVTDCLLKTDNGETNSPSQIERLRNQSRSTPVLLVRDSATALTQLAVWNRHQSHALMIGITGSVGKTTTRQMIFSVLSSVHQGIQSPANFNNELGVPISLLRLTSDHEFASIEMGASGPHEIAPLALTARPEFGVITRVCPAHLEGFGDIDTVFRTKRELIESLPSHGVAFLNGDDAMVRRMQSSAPCPVVLFGEAPDCDIRPEKVLYEDGVLCFAIHGFEYRVKASGRHLLCSALAAVAIGQQIGLSPVQIQSGLASFHPGTGRGSMIQLPSCTVIDDTYNASPASVAAAIESVSDWKSCRHQILVLGDMKELGQQSAEFHRQAGAAMAATTISHVLAFGEFADDVAAGFLESSAAATPVPLQNRISVFHDMHQLCAVLDCILSDGDVVLVKGSRSVGMERVVEHLRNLSFQQPRSPQTVQKADPADLSAA
jgi:UDP-N-acetylmuramoyl-tripeptide--D-alanyl-D-alanine ligase